MFFIVLRSSPSTACHRECYYTMHMVHKLRTEATTKKYIEYCAHQSLEAPCSLCEKTALEEFLYWRIVENIFPYDVIAATHHMIIPRRHITERELTPEEMEELQHIKETFLQRYDHIIENTYHMKSIPTHFHLHLIICKDVI